MNITTNIQAENEQKYSDKFIISVLLIQQFLGALAFPISKFGLNYIEPFTFAFYRFMLSAVVLLFLTLRRQYKVKIEKKDYWKIFGLAVLIIPLNQTLYLFGQSYTAAGHGSLLFATVPIWILLAAMIHLKEKPTRRRLIGVLIGFIGVVIVMWSGALEFSMDYVFGDLMIVLAVIAWAYYTIYGKPMVRKYGAIRVTTYALALGALLYLPFGLIAAVKFDYAATPLNAWWAVVYMSLGTSVAAYILWYWVLKYFEASRIAVFHNLQPFLAAVVALFWLGEPLTPSFIIGGITAIIGVIIAEI